MHRTYSILLLATLASCIGGANTGDSGSGARDLPMKVDVAPSDVAEAIDPGLFDPGVLDDEGPDVAITECTPGAIEGIACAPSQKAFVSYADVVLDLQTDCGGGQQIHRQVKADAKGLYAFQDVPPGKGTLSFKKGSFSGSTFVTVQPGKVLDLATGTADRCFKPASTKIAVIGGSADRIEDLLTELGLEHDLYDGGTSATAEKSMGLALLRDPVKLGTYDVLFVDCSSGVQALLDAGGDEIIQNVRNFVAAGHSFYASDWAWAYVESTWPDAIEFAGKDLSWEKGDGDAPDASAGPRQGPGPNQAEKDAGMPALALSADIVDDGLAAALGTVKTTLFFDLGTWVVIDQAAGGTIHIQGRIQSEQGGDWGYRPFVVSFRPSQAAGLVIYTTFHNIAQADAGADVADIKAILSYLVFTL